MIKDVKSYINTVGYRLYRAFDMQSFGEEEEAEFWARAASLMANDSIPPFSEIALWFDDAFQAPIHFVYRKEGDKMVLFRRHIISENMQYLVNKQGQKKKISKQERSGFESRLINLDQKIAFHNSFEMADIASFGIGRCQYIPLLDGDDFWGIYCVGPHVQLPENLHARIALLSRILSGWLIKRHVEEKEKRYNLSDRVRQGIRHETGRHTHFDNIAHYLMEYAIKFAGAKSGLLVTEGEAESFQIVQSVYLEEHIVSAINHNANVANFTVDTFFKEHNELLNDIGYVNYLRLEIENENKGIAFYLLFEEKAPVDVSGQELVQEICDTLGGLIRFKTQNESFVEKVLETYYKMLRDLERAREASNHHTPRIMAFCEKFGRAFDLSEQEQQLLLQTAKLHDIGYVSTDLNTMGAEVEHPVLGKMMLEGLSLPDEVLMGVAAHQEWVDGAGTPLGLMREQIPWTAKIVSIFEYVVEFVEQNNADTAKSGEEWTNELNQNLLSRAGKEFDMLLIPTTVELIEKLGWEECCKLGTNYER